ncbi:hypothetical protein [Streptomyces sp. NPDC007369]|uniref:hypothetical protein n=1 Tax=Streptomyces sp. NPDC007369 TaxID=3154589 RepID=UPI0033D532FD
MNETATPTPLMIKSVVGGGLEDKSWTTAIGDLQVRLRKLENGGDTPFGVTATFFIPGETYRPKFSGIRIGSFLEEFQSLVVQVALPEHPQSDAQVEVLALLDEVILKAEGWGKRKKRISGQLEAVRGVADYLRGRDVG